MATTRGQERWKARARAARDHPVFGRVLRRPVESLNRRGVSIPAAVLHRLPHHGEFVTTCPGGGQFRMIARGEYLETAVRWQGILGHEPECMAAWVDLARTSRVILDVGANTGLYALIAGGVAPNAQVHAFEPLARVADRLRANVTLNPASDIRVHQSAVGAAAGTADIHDPGGVNCYSASMNPEFLAEVEKDVYPVEVVTIDGFAAAHGLEAVDLVKLDVEGFEEDVLDGMSQTIERFRPAIFMEMLSDDNARVAAHLDRLAADGYVLYHLHRDGVRRSSSLRRPPEGMNVLLMPEGRSLASTPELSSTP